MEDPTLIQIRLNICSAARKHKPNSSFPNTTMNVLVASIEDKFYDFFAEVYNISYEADRQNFSMPRPIGDDWLQRINHSPIPPPEMVRIQEKNMFVLFNSAKWAKEFSDWLVSAEAEAQEGYRTIRGWIKKIPTTELGVRFCNMTADGYAWG